MDAALQRLVSGDGMTHEDLALFQLILNDGGSESGAALALAGELTRTGAALEIARGRQQLAPRAPNPPLFRLRRLRRTAAKAASPLRSQPPWRRRSARRSRPRRRPPSATPRSAGCRGACP